MNSRGTCQFCGAEKDNVKRHERLCPMNPRESQKKHVDVKIEKSQETPPLKKTPLTEGQLKTIIEEIKGKLKTWKVEPGYFTMKEGLELLPIGTTSTDMKRIETITKINTQNDMAKAGENYMMYLYVVGGLATVMVVAYMVIGAFKGS